MPYLRTNYTPACNFARRPASIACHWPRYIAVLSPLPPALLSVLSLCSDFTLTSTRIRLLGAKAAGRRRATATTRCGTGCRARPPAQSWEGAIGPGLGLRLGLRLGRTRDSAILGGRDWAWAGLGLALRPRSSSHGHASAATDRIGLLALWLAL